MYHQSPGLPRKQLCILTPIVCSRPHKRVQRWLLQWSVLHTSGLYIGNLVSPFLATDIFTFIIFIKAMGAFFVATTERNIGRPGDLCCGKTDCLELELEIFTAVECDAGEKPLLSTCCGSFCHQSAVKSYSVVFLVKQLIWVWKICRPITFIAQPRLRWMHL